MLTSSGHFDQMEKLKLVALVPRMQLSARTVLRDHLNQIKVVLISRHTIILIKMRINKIEFKWNTIKYNNFKDKIDAEIVPELAKIPKMENQFVYDEVSKAFQKCVLTVKTNLHQMKKYLPDPQVAPFASILTNVSQLF